MLLEASIMHPEAPFMTLIVQASPMFITYNQHLQISSIDLLYKHVKIVMMIVKVMPQFEASL